MLGHLFLGRVRERENVSDVANATTITCNMQAICTYSIFKIKSVPGLVLRIHSSPASHLKDHKLSISGHCLIKDCVNTYLILLFYLIVNPSEGFCFF